MTDDTADNGPAQRKVTDNAVYTMQWQDRNAKRLTTLLTPSKPMSCPTVGRGGGGASQALFAKM